MRPSVKSVQSVAYPNFEGLRAFSLAFLDFVWIGIVRQPRRALLWGNEMAAFGKRRPRSRWNDRRQVNRTRQGRQRGLLLCDPFAGRRGEQRAQADPEPAWSPIGIRGSGRIEAVRRDRRRPRASFVDRCLSQAARLYMEGIVKRARFLEKN